MQVAKGMRRTNMTSTRRGDSGEGSIHSRAAPARHMDGLVVTMALRGIERMVHGIGLQRPHQFHLADRYHRLRRCQHKQARHQQ